MWQRVPLWPRRSGQRRPWYRVVLWWELRRVPYNVLLVLAGGTGLLLFLLVDLLPPRLALGQDDIEYLFAALGGVVIANLCYTGGWIVELAIRRQWPDSAERFGPAAFRAGLLFSAIVALLPAMANAIVWLSRWLAAANWF